jgi:Gram-negative bacterial TonB protein C-terminal
VSRLGFHLTFAIAIAAAATSAQAQTPVQAPPIPLSDLRSLVTDVDALNLASPSVPPFHLSATFQTFDYKGAPYGDGSVELYWDGKAISRKELVYRGKRRVEIADQKTEWVDGIDAPTSQSEKYLVETLDPINNLPATKDIQFSSHPMSFKGIDMDCVLLAFPNLAIDTDVRLRVVPPADGFCFSRANRALRLVQKGGFVVLYDDLSSFHGHAFSSTIYLRFGAVKRGTLHIAKVEDWKPDSALLTAPASWVREPLAVDGKVKQASVISRPLPNHLPTGSQTVNVLLFGVIDREGRLKDLEVTDAPENMFTAVALEAVSRWTYQPRTIDGVPVETDTSILVNANSSHY